MSHRQRQRCGRRIQPALVRIACARSKCCVQKTKRDKEGCSVSHARRLLGAVTGFRDGWLKRDSTKPHPARTQARFSHSSMAQWPVSGGRPRGRWQAGCRWWANDCRRCGRAACGGRSTGNDRAGRRVAGVIVVRCATQSAASVNEQRDAAGTLELNLGGASACGCVATTLFAARLGLRWAVLHRSRALA